MLEPDHAEPLGLPSRRVLPKLSDSERRPGWLDGPVSVCSQPAASWGGGHREGPRAKSKERGENIYIVAVFLT